MMHKFVVREGGAGLVNSDPYVTLLVLGLHPSLWVFGITNTNENLNCSYPNPRRRFVPPVIRVTRM